MVIHLERKKVLRDGFNTTEYDEKRKISMDTAQKISDLIKEDLELEDEEVVAVTAPNEVFTIKRDND